MNNINPIGRKPGNTIQPMACMCSKGMASAKVDNFLPGFEDNCFHCGCSCSSDKYKSNNNVNAVTTFHTS